MRTPIVDSTGKQTHVWRAPDSAPKVADRLLEISSALASEHMTPWSELSNEQKVSRTRDMTNGLLDEQGLQDWDFVLIKDHYEMGRCDYTNKQVQISSVLIHNAAEEYVRSTIIHELAHALTTHEADHGEEWQSMDIALGGNGEAFLAVPGLPPFPGSRKFAVITTKDENGIKTSREVPVYLGDKVQIWDGNAATVMKITASNFVATSSAGTNYIFPKERAEEYADDYKRLQEPSEIEA